LFSLSYTDFTIADSEGVFWLVPASRAYQPRNGIGLVLGGQMSISHRSRDTLVPHEFLGRPPIDSP